MLGATALVMVGGLVALAAALWAGLLSLGEEAAVGEALHTLGDAPPPRGSAGAGVPLHRALHVARLGLLGILVSELLLVAGPALLCTCWHTKLTISSA